MIEYEEDWLVKLLFKREGSVAGKAAVYGFFSACLAVLLLFAVELDTSHTLGNLLKEISKSQLWNASTVVIGLLLGFRTKTAMSRFWEGTSLLHQMRGEWFDTVSNCVTFSIAAKKVKPEEVTRFRHTLVRLMSVCHATALEEIAGSQVKLEAIDTFGLDTKTLKHLTDCSNRYKFNQVEIMVHLIQTLITVAHDDGILKIPPPILSRVYQTLSRGFVNLLNAKKICDTRFPFPYAQIIAMLLIVSLFLTPLQIVAVVETKYMAVLFTFVPVWGLVALNLVASELEDPFGTDSNDLPLEHFQSEMNACLLMLLHPNSDHVPGVRDSCNFVFKELLATVVHIEDGEHYTYSSNTSLETQARRLSSYKSWCDSERSDCSEEEGVEAITSGKSSAQVMPPANEAAADAETSKKQQAVEVEGLCDGFTLPEIMIPCHGWQERHVDCDTRPSVYLDHAEQFSQVTSAPGVGTNTMAAPTWAPKVTPTTTTPPESASRLPVWTPHASGTAASAREEGRDDGKASHGQTDGSCCHAKAAPGQFDGRAFKGQCGGPCFGSDDTVGAE